jgi:hypothetical protein
VRTINDLMAVKPSVAILPACPPLWATPVSGAPAIASWSAVTGIAAAWTAALARPKSRVEATGVGYAALAAADARRGVDGSGRDVPGGTAVETRFIGTNGSNGKQQDQLHLMSRRDPRTWRPPA